MNNNQTQTRMHRLLSSLCLSLLLLATVSLGAAQTTSRLTVDSHDITVLLNSNETFVVFANQLLQKDVQVTLKTDSENHLGLDPVTFLYPEGSTQNQTVVITGRNAGKVQVTAEANAEANAEPNAENAEIVEDVFVRVTVAKSRGLIYTSDVFGWVYFVAWSVSFYPQIWINYRRKSVEGLNFDFITLNIVGFTLYSLFNCGLYFIEALQKEYEKRHPHGLNPVMLNDVFFSLHAMFATSITIIQCLIYERGQQKVSYVAYGILGIFAVVVIVAAGLAGGSEIEWLDFLYYCSYVKLTITIIKYVPQALMNYRRKSTVGWSIGNILLDFTGGTLSMLQMILNGYNYDDWASIFGDPTKFGLGLFSVLFDVFFMLQHYVFYRHAKEQSSSDLTIVTEAGQNQGKDEPPPNDVTNEKY